MSTDHQMDEVLSECENIFALIEFIISVQS